MTPSGRLIVLESGVHMGGVQHSTYNLLRSPEMLHRLPLLLAPEEGPLTALARQAGCEVRIVPGGSVLSTSLWLRDLARIPNPAAWLWNLIVVLRRSRRVAAHLRRGGDDVLFTKGMTAHLVGGLAARSRRIPCVWHLQDLLSERYKRMNILIMSLAARFLHCTAIADSQLIRNQYRGAFASSMRVVYNGVDTSLFTPGMNASLRMKLGIPADAFIIGHAARFTPWKGQMQMVKAYRAIAGEDESMHLVFAGDALYDGDAYHASVLAAARNSAYGDRIHFLGHRDDLDEVFRMMDLFVYTSLEKDTAPLSLLSAMSTGVPIVAFAIPGVMEVLEHGRTAHLVEVGDVGALAHAITLVKGDARYRGALAAEVRRDAVDRFDINRYAETCIEFLEDQAKLYRSGRTKRR